MIENLYHGNGFLNMGAVIAAPFPFTVVIGARGVGKTYGTLLDVALEHPQTFIYFRLTRAVIDLIIEPALQPFKRINIDRQTDIRPEYKRGLGRFYNGEQLIGYAAALSTFANVRGFDGSDILIMIVDEFLPEAGVTLRYNSYIALMHAYETINRNREFEGRAPLKLLLLSNSDNIYDDIIAGFGIGDDLYRMQQTGEEQLETKNGNMLLIRPAAGMFKEEKKKTALYQIAGSEYTGVALDNRFVIETEQNIKQRPLQEYTPIAFIMGVCIYRHKSNGRYYVTTKLSGAPRMYDAGQAERRRFFRECPNVLKAYEKRRIDYENVNVQQVFKKIYT